MITILALALIVRLINLSQSLWLDEAIEVLAVKGNSFLQLTTQYAIGDFHPPLYHLILAVWTNLVGYSEVAIRFPSVIFGVTSCYFVYLIGKKLFSDRVGKIAALFLAVNPLAVYYSQEARMYSLAMLAVTASVWFYICKNWRWFFLSLLVALGTDYLPYLMLPVFWFLTKDRKKLLFIFALVFVAFFPWWPYFWQQLVNGLNQAKMAPEWGRVVGGFDLKALPLTIVKFIFGRIPTQWYFALPVVFYLWAMIKVKSKVLWLWLVFPLLIGFLLSLKISVFSYFRFLFVLPAMMLLLAASAAKWRPVLPTVLFVSLASLLAFNLNPSWQKENWRSAVAYVRQDPGIIALPSLAQDAPLRYYGPELAIVDKPEFNDAKVVYLFRYVQEIFDPKDTLRQTLETENFKRTEERAFNGVLVWKYKNPSLRSGTLRSSASPAGLTK